MKARFVVASLLLAGLALELAPGCSTQVPLATRGQKCEFDEQCVKGLVCRCVRRRNSDDEGPDEILAPGVCEGREHRCSGDAGPPTDASDAAVEVTDGALEANDAPAEAASDADGGD